MEIGQKQAILYFVRKIFDKNGNIVDMDREQFFKMIKPVLETFKIKSELKRSYMSSNSLDEAVYDAIYDLLRLDDTLSLNKIKAKTGGRKDLIRDILAEDGWWDFDSRKITITLEDFN